MQPRLYDREQIRILMQDSNLREVSRRSGICYETLLDVLRGKDSRYSTIEKLTKYIDTKHEESA